jgi:hypothetical protein
MSISGATSYHYALTDADVGQTLVVVVTASNSSSPEGGEAQASSTASAEVEAKPPSETQAPSVSGTATDGSRLTGGLGSWSGAPAPTLTYQWERCTGGTCATIPGTQGEGVYTATDADVGHSLSFSVSASNAGYYGGGTSGASAQTSTIEAVAPSESSAPAISGTAQDGQALTASPGSWSGAPAPSYSYQWQNCNASGQACTSI